MLKLVQRLAHSPMWYVRGTVEGVPILQSTKTADKAEAEAFLQRLKNDYGISSVKRQLPLSDADFEMREYLKLLAQYTRNRAGKKAVGAHVTSDFVMQLYLEQNGRCELSGVPFRLERFGDSQNNMPFAPSLDRIDNGKPYSKDNVRLVCRIVNFALNTWGDAALFEMALGLSDTWRKSKREFFSVESLRERLGDVEDSAQTIEIAKKKGRHGDTLRPKSINECIDLTGFFSAL